MGVAIATYLLRGALGDSAVRYAVTVPGVYGEVGAFVGEVTISFVLMITILFLTNRVTLARYTPYFVGALYAIYITFESPLSGMSMTPREHLAQHFGPVTGTHFGSISLRRHWECWLPRRSISHRGIGSYCA